MSYTVAEFLRGVYPLTWNYWFTAVMWSDWYISAINQALDYIYAYKWQKKNWMIRTEALWAWVTQWSFNATTNYPIVDVMNFWCWDKLECITTQQKNHKECCGWTNPQCNMACDVSCEPCEVKWVVKDMILVWPWSVTLPWQFKVSWWADWFWGMFGNYVSWQLPRSMCLECVECPQLYLTYNAWFNPVRCASDKIPLPQPYITALQFLVVWFTISRFITHRSQDDLMYIQMADRFLDGFNQLQANVPTFIRNKI